MALTLYYLPVRARGEALTMLAGHAGVALVNETVPLSEWPAKKERLPAGKTGAKQLPVMALPDGTLMPESLEIAKYIAGKADPKLQLLGKDPAQAERLWLLPDTKDTPAGDMSTNLNLINPILNYFPKEDAEKKIPGFFETAPKVFAYLEQELGGGKFYGGDAPHIGDFQLFHYVDNLRLLDGGVTVDKLPKLKGWENSMRSLPAVAKHCAERPKSGTAEIGTPASIIATTAAPSTLPVVQEALKGAEAGAAGKGLARRKVLFMTIPFKGHLLHTVRLSEWFLQFPTEYEVHVGCPEECFPDLPEGVHTHTMDPMVSSQSMGAPMAKAGKESTDWYHSQVLMMEDIDPKMIEKIILFGIDTAERVRPDVVVCDHSLNIHNALYTFCRHANIPLVQITSMGRPETMMLPENAAIMLQRYPNVFAMIGAKLGGMRQVLTKRIGMDLLPPDQSPTIILPSASCLVDATPPPEAIFTGPFLPLPGLIEDQKMRRLSSFNMQISGALQEWLHQGDPTLPVIYVALGTLVTPTAPMMQRLVDGLDSEKWRVIWALPDAHRATLPRELGKNWHLMTFAPQFALLKSGYISAFLSHCGGNSTMESLCQGVPMICMPFFGDQYEWSQSVCTHGKAGVLVDKLASTPEQIREAAQKVLDTPAYKENAKTLAKKMLEASREQLTFLQEHWPEKNIKIEKMTKVGVPIGAGIIDAVMNGKDPHSRLPSR